MTDKPPISATNANLPIQGPGSDAAHKQSGNKTGGVEFKALLERLQDKAQALQSESHSVEKPEELAGAVDRAKDSLKDALSLGDQLLEAFREIRQQSEGSASPAEDEGA